MQTTFSTNAKKLQKQYERALIGLKANVRMLPGYDKPVLTEGGMYYGVWLEGGPHEGVLYGEYDPDIARNNHTVFFDTMDAEGFIAPYVREKAGAGHLQTVVPIGMTALECVDKLGQEELLPLAYASCARYDQWLSTYRNSRGTGLVEVHCTWDTGHDNSPRHAGHPNHCPDFNTKRHGGEPGLPVLAPDLSATKYRGRVALAEMAKRLGKPREEALWLEGAHTLRQAILAHTFDQETGMFYDLDADKQWVRVKSDVLLRVAMCHVPDQALFEQLCTAHIFNPKEFWTPYPFPSVAADDPAFTWTYPENCWGGASQALTALRAPIWMEHYGKHAELVHVMKKWEEALLDTEVFQQQMDPFSGRMNTTQAYSPCMLVLTDFIARLYGTKFSEQGMLWGCHSLPHGNQSVYTSKIAGHEVCMRIENGRGRAMLDGRPIFTAYGDCRVRTDFEGNILSVYQTGLGRPLVELEPNG